MLRPVRNFVKQAVDQGISAQVISTLFFTAMIGLLFLAAQIGISRYAPFFAGQRCYNFWLLWLIGLVAGCLGWLSGTFLSPLGIQVNAAQKIFAALSVFWSGVIVGHLTEIGKILGSWQTATMSSASKVRIVFGLGIYILAVCATFNTRFLSLKAGESKISSSSKAESLPNPLEELAPHP